jgi:hypothetical protein
MDTLQDQHHALCQERALKPQTRKCCAPTSSTWPAAVHGRQPSRVCLCCMAHRLKHSRHVAYVSTFLLQVPRCMAQWLLDGQSPGRQHSSHCICAEAKPPMSLSPTSTKVRPQLVLQDTLNLTDRQAGSVASRWRCTVGHCICPEATHLMSLSPASTNEQPQTPSGRQIDQQAALPADEDVS